jgi:hypothetical protein
VAFIQRLDFLTPPSATTEYSCKQSTKQVIPLKLKWDNYATGRDNNESKKKPFFNDAGQNIKVILFYLLDI